jgi:hypothetical protein
MRALCAELSHVLSAQSDETYKFFILECSEGPSIRLTASRPSIVEAGIVSLFLVARSERGRRVL